MAVHDVETIIENNHLDTKHKLSCNNAAVGIDNVTGSYNIINVDENGIQSIISYENTISKSLITGSEPIHIFGRNLDVNNTRVDVWEGPTAYYVFPPDGGIQMKIVSDNVNDTLAGTGIQKVRIHYLDTSFTDLYEDKNMNGTTPVTTTATNILRVNSIHSIQTGSNSYAVGNISLTNTAGTITYAIILATYNESRQAIYTVPAEKTFYLNHWQGSSGSNTGSHFTRIVLRTTSRDGVLWANTFIGIDEMGTQNNGESVIMPIAIACPSGTDIKIATKSDAAAAHVIVMGAFHGWLENN